MTNLSEKYAEISQYILQRGDVRVSELTETFPLSEATIRRVLTSLAQEGMIRRFHGGATVIDPQSLSSVKQREVSCEREKQAIAQMAAGQVRDGMTLMMLGGTSVQALCPYLKQGALTVITNSLPVVNALNWKENIKLVVLGGILNPMELEMRGSLTEHSLSRLRADILFIGATGFHSVHGLMTDDANAVNTYTQCMRISDRIFVLADSTKFTRPYGLLSVAGPGELTGVFTDDQLPAEIRRDFEGSGTLLHIAKVDRAAEGL